MIDFYSGYIMIDNLNSQTTVAVMARMNDNWRRFGLPRRIITDNGPCFRSEKFHNFCQKMDIHHDTTSPHYHQSNGRVERAIRTVRQIYNKFSSDTEVTHAVLAYHDTPLDAELPSPGELFFNRRLNTRLSSVHPGPTIPEEQKEKLADKRAAHLKPQKETLSYTANQPVWYSQDGSSEWKPGLIDNKDLHPESYWVVTDENSRLRRNINDIKPRREYQEHKMSVDNNPRIEPETDAVPEPQTNRATLPMETQPPEPVVEPPTAHKSASEPTPLRRSKRERKSTKRPDFIYS